MTIYRVRWEIDIEAESRREAAEKAREIQQDPNGLANSFEVAEYEKITTHTMDIGDYITVLLPEDEHESG